MQLNGNTINLLHTLIFLAGLGAFIALTLAGEKEAAGLAIGYVVAFIGGGAITQAATSTKKIDNATVAMTEATASTERAAAVLEADKNNTATYNQ